MSNLTAKPLNLLDFRYAEFIGVREVRANLSKLISRNRVFVVTHHGKPKMAFVPFNGLVATLEELSKGSR